MEITASLLRAIMPAAHEQDLLDYCEPLSDACEEFEINTKARLAAFLGQIAEESDQLWHQRTRYGTERGEEYASGDAYEGRHDLGNLHPGDGAKYKGRGPVQCTGFTNYHRLGTALDVDLVTDPEQLLDPVLACRAAGYYWKAHGCNELADAGNFIAITRKINGGTNGLASRQAFEKRALEAMRSTSEP